MDLFGDPVRHVHPVFDAIDWRTQRRAEGLGVELLDAVAARDFERAGAPGYFFAAHLSAA